MRDLRAAAAPNPVTVGEVYNFVCFSDAYRQVIRERERRNALDYVCGWFDFFCCCLLNIFLYHFTLVEIIYSFSIMLFFRILCTTSDPSGVATAVGL